MEISRRHLQDTERAELRDVLLVNDSSGIGSRLAELLEKDQGDYFARIELAQAQSSPSAEEMQRQVDGLTRNQRRVLVKRMKKAKKK